MTVPAVNGTFMVSLSVPAAELGSDEITFVADDSAGHRLTAPEPADPHERIAQQLETCWVTPDGTVLPTRVPPRPGQRCLPAIRWR